jgi:outer membrane biosynthesis protein TonB
MLYARSIGEQDEAMSVPAKVPRYFGVAPGRQFFRAAQSRLAYAWALVVARLRLLKAVWLAQAREWIETLRLEREAATAWRLREQALQALGEAVYHDGTSEAEQAKARVAELDDVLLRLGQRIREAQEERQRRIELAWREEGPTLIAVPPVPEPAPVPHEPPGPLIVPEPEPVPHEPPGPLIVPEPEPVPHEPPGPVIVPEPEPPQGH